MNRNIKSILIWFLPAVMLLVALLPVALPVLYMWILLIVVTVCAIFIAYLLFTERPRYYIPWGVVFIFIALIYNPIIHINVTTGALPMNLLVALIFIANWWFVFRNKI